MPFFRSFPLANERGGAAVAKNSNTFSRRLNMRWNGGLAPHCRRGSMENSSAFASPLWLSFYAYHLPGWKNKVCTKDARTRQQREADRKVRQLEKLPPVEALHDFQYPYEKTILSDYMFQYPLFENDLDTPHLFYLTPPPNFFLYWNVSDFDRTNYPAVPAEDHRLLAPSHNCQAWEKHRARALKYLEKHQIVPHFFPYVDFKANLSVVFSGQYSFRSFASTSMEKGRPTAPCSSSSPSPLPQVNALKRRNFWFTSHCGNYIELKELQHPPTIFIQHRSPGNEWDEKNANAPLAPERHAKHTEGKTCDEEISQDNVYYTLLMVSPDYPYRLPFYEDKREERGFFLHYMVTNLTPTAMHKTLSSCPSSPETNVDEKNDRVLSDSSSPLPWKGDVVVSYVPPLPTEDAGTTRHLCVLYRQTQKVALRSPLSPSSDGCRHTLEWEHQCFPLALRSNFRLHDPSRALPKMKQGTVLLHDFQKEGMSNTGKAAIEEASTRIDGGLDDLIAVENALVSSVPVAITFFQTKWDIQVQEYYQKIDHPEPAAPVDEMVEALLEFHASKPEEFRIRSRHRPDGSTNIGDDPQFWGEQEPTRMMNGSMQSLWSRRTAMGSNGVPITYPH